MIAQISYKGFAMWLRLPCFPCRLAPLERKELKNHLQHGRGPWSYRRQSKSLDFSGLQAFTQLSGVSQSVTQRVSCKVTFSFMLALVRVSPFLSNRKITKERCNLYTPLLLNEKCVKMTRSRKKKKTLKSEEISAVTSDHHDFEV